MRTAALAAASLVLVGAYLMIAASLAFSPMAIALGILAIAVVTAVAMAMPGSRAAGQPAR